MPRVARPTALAIAVRTVGALALLATAAPAPVHAQEGVRSVTSAHDVPTTVDRLVAALEAKGLTVFARIDHGANAAGVDLELGPAEVLLFGNPKLGTPLMRCAPTMGLDLPQRMLAFIDSDGRTRLTWNDPAWLATRHGIRDDECAQVLATVDGALQGFAKAATAAR